MSEYNVKLNNMETYAYLMSHFKMTCYEAADEMKKRGLFDEMGSIYAHDILMVEVDGEWKEVEHTEAQLKLKKQVSAMGF